MSNSSLTNASASTCLPAQVTSPPDYQRLHSRGGDERSGRLHREESGDLANIAGLAKDLSRKHSRIHLNKNFSVSSDQINQSNHPGLIGMKVSTAKLPLYMA